jgi:hypothetical protein
MSISGCSEVLLTMDGHRLDEDAEGFDDADDEYFPHIQQYYASLTPDLRRLGFFDNRLASFHEGPNLPEDRHFYTAPKSLSHLHDPASTPRDHPLRAIAWILETAAPSSVVRVFSYSLTDPIAIDLLIHAGATREVKVILHPKEKSRRAMKQCVDQHGNNAFLENMEIRLANLLGDSQCESRLVQMHDKSIITDNYTTYGSYNLSSFARVGNWESFCVTDTHPKCRDAFDRIWEAIPERQAERHYTDLQSSIIGPRRTARTTVRETEEARRLVATESRQEQVKRGPVFNEQGVHDSGRICRR